MIIKMASCLNQNTNPATGSTDQNANITLEDCMCPICLSILIEPVSLPCKHVLCMPCFRANIEESSMCCPMCRIRISNWSRQASRKKCLVDEKRWSQIKSLFPEHVKRRLDGTDDYDDDLRASSRGSSHRLAEPGEIRKEYEDELRKVAEEENERKRAEAEASEVLVRKLQEEELRKVNKWEKEKSLVEQTDEDIARQLEEALRKEVSSPPGIRTTRQHPPTLLDKFINRSKRSASCAPNPTTPDNRPASKPRSASLFFPCSKSRTKHKSQPQKDKGVVVSSSALGRSEELRSDNVVDSQQPSTSAAYVDVQKPENARSSKGLPSAGVVKSSGKITAGNQTISPNVSKYLQLGTDICEDVFKSDSGVSDVSVEKRISSELTAQLSKSYSMSGYDLQKTCANLTQHLYNKSCAVFPGEDFQSLYPNLSSPVSNQSSSLYSPLLIDESKVKGLDSSIPDVMLSSCANMSEISAIKSPSVKEVIVLSSDSEISRENSVVPIMSIPVIDISDSSENNTPVPMSVTNIGGAGHSMRALSVTVERLPTPPLALMHQSSEEEPSTSLRMKQKRSISVESCDSISHEMVHFKPIQICPRTPPKRLPNGKAMNPPIVVSTPRNLNKRLCLSPPAPSLPKPSAELSPVVKRHLQNLAAHSLKQVKVHSKCIETDPDLVAHPSSPFKPCSSISNHQPLGLSFTQASKRLDFDGSGDHKFGSGKRHFAQIADLIEQNRVESFALPEDFCIAVKMKNKTSEVKKDLVVNQVNKEIRNCAQKAPVLEKSDDNSVDSVQKSPGRVYSMRRNRKRAKISQDYAADSVKKKLVSSERNNAGSIRTIEDWIRSSQDKQKDDYESMIDLKLNTTCSVSMKRLCNRGEGEDAGLCLEMDTDSKSNSHSQSKTVQPGHGKLKKPKQSNSQAKLEFKLEQRQMSECDSDCSSIGERLVMSKKSKKTRGQLKAQSRKKRNYSQVEQSPDKIHGKQNSNSGADGDDVESMDHRLALQLQEKFNYEAKNPPLTMYRLRGSEESMFKRRARSAAATIKSKAS